MTETKIKRVIQIAVIAAVTLVAVLLVTLIVQLAIKGNLSRRQQMLENELEKLKTQERTIEEEIEYRKSQEYIEKYAREQLGLVKDGETKYVGKSQ